MIFFLKGQDLENHIGDVMVSVLASIAVDRGFKPGRVKPKTIKLLFVASSLSKQHSGERANERMCQSGATCLSADCCFTIKSNSACWFSTKWTSSSSH